MRTTLGTATAMPALAPDDSAIRVGKSPWVGKLAQLLRRLSLLAIARWGTTNVSSLGDHLRADIGVGLRADAGRNRHDDFYTVQRYMP